MLKEMRASHKLVRGESRRGLSPIVDMAEQVRHNRQDEQERVCEEQSLKHQDNHEQGEGKEEVANRVSANPMFGI